MDSLFLSLSLFILSFLFVKYKRRSRFATTAQLLLILLYIVLTILYIVADYFTGEGLNESVVITLNLGLSEAGFKEYKYLIAGVLLFVILMLFSLYIYYKRVRNFSNISKPKAYIYNILLLLAFLTLPTIHDMRNLYKNTHQEQSKDFNLYYKKPSVKSQKDKLKGYNIIYIYAESFERTYFDEKIFPNLTTNLKRLKDKDSIEFTNINQVRNAGCTIAGIVASQCGVPLYVPNGGPNSMKGIDKFLPKAICLGDTLKDLGFYLVKMQGASLKFAGKGKFYKTHKFDEMYGKEELISRLEDKSYLNGWGLYDDTLLNLAYEKFIDLSKSGKRFGLFLLTLDTHHPNGHLSKSCRDNLYQDGKNSILNCVKCSDYLLSNFIKKVRNSPYGDKTLIVLTSDHLVMQNTASHLLKKGNRKELFLIFDPENRKHTIINKTGSVLDIGATILHTLGVKSDLGLGRDLFEKKSLWEEIQSFNNKLLSWRDEILKLWKFPKLKPFYVDINKSRAYNNNFNYSLPVLLKVDNNSSIKPYFEFDSSKNLAQFLKDFKPTQKFIWIDKCIKISHLSDRKNSSHSNYCVAGGTLSSYIKIYELNKSITKIDDKSLFNDKSLDGGLYYSRMLKMFNVTNSHRYLGKELPFSKGFIDKEDISIDDKNKRGILTYGPYIRLKEGKYKFIIRYKSSEPNNKLVGSWDITLNGGNLKLKRGELFGTNSKYKDLTGEFSISKEDTTKGGLEIRTFYNGEGKLSINSLTIIPQN